MRINRKLNLVFPIDTDKGVVYVHSTPISRAVFEKYYFVISKVFSRIVGEGPAYLATSGPRVAAIMLRDVAQDLGRWDGPDGVERGLVAEVRRLTNALMPAEAGGWEMVPFQEVVDRKLLDEDDVAEAEGLLTFFICSSAMYRAAEAEDLLTGSLSIWDAQISSLSCTEYRDSLPTSTETASSGETVPTSSVPS